MPLSDKSTLSSVDATTTLAETQSAPKPAPKPVAKGEKPAFEDLYTNEIVTLLVGPEKKEFKIHKGLLCHESSYFQAALTGDWKEGLEGPVLLVEDSPATYQLFFKWLYTSKLFEDDLKPAGCLISLWVLADKRGVPALGNLCIDLLVAKCPDKAVMFDSVKYIYRNTVPGAALRRLLVDLWAWRLKVSHLDPDPDHFPPAFLMDLLLAKDKLPKVLCRTDAPYTKNICQYHDHTDERGRCSKKLGNTL
ncbi:MAG: hypothetical protein M1812_007766 [Candelaria pacifica]|nr:MAG: hypothetical protein M1812_007766 [Candelaria pacifica]